MDDAAIAAPILAGDHEDGEGVEEGNGGEGDHRAGHSENAADDPRGPDDLESPECEDTRTGPFHYKPPAEQVELHRLHHHPYRSWCTWCRMGKAHGEHHRASGHKSEIPIVGVDYFYLTEGAEAKNDESFQVRTRGEMEMNDETIERDRQDGKIVKCFILRCHASKSIFAWVVPYKGEGEDGYVTGLIVTALRWLGYIRLIIKSDNEVSLIALVRAAIELAKVEVPGLSQLGEEHPTAYDSQANGATESGIRNV